MQVDTSENKTQQNIIELLKGMGYRFITKEGNKTLRGGKLKEVLLKEVLKEQLGRINGYTYKGGEYKFSEKNIDQAVTDLDYPLNEGPSKANEMIYEMLTLGKSYEEKLPDGTSRSFSLKYIDFKNPDNNVLHFTEEFSVEKETILGKETTRRPDIVIFINGIPLAVIELKKSTVSIREGISQHIRNQKEHEIPHLYKYVQIVAAGNTMEAKYATAGTPDKFWSVWKEEEDHGGILDGLIKDRRPTELDRTVYSLFNRNRMMDLIYAYTIFDGKVKKIARYQQYFSIKKTLARIDNFDDIGVRKGGLVWHTQGSGKSLTMVMLAQGIMRKITTAQVVIVTDRKSLDKQIKDTFAKVGLDVEKARDGKHLVEMLRSNKSHVITTIINKFDKAVRSSVSIECPNTFVLVDESHRTQYGSMHVKMKKVFPLACYIGFTGTPLMKNEKNSFDKFGGMIHKYTIDQAVEDKAVLPLLYEGRLVDQWISNKAGLNKKFELISRGLSEEQQEDLKAKWARFQKVASSEQRLEAIAMDINEHYRNTWQGTGFKGMLATNSKFEAIRYHKIFEQYGDIKTAFVISPSDSREGHTDVDTENKLVVQQECDKILRKYKDFDEYETRIKDEFIHGDEVELLIVVDKLLTGFDAPRASVLYIDKELREHKLLQSIARVNRLFDGKDFGYVIDYRGLLGNLDQALTSYSSLEGFDEDDIGRAVIDIKNTIAEVKSVYSRLLELFSPVKNKEDQEEYEVYLADEVIRADFLELLKNFAKLMKIALSSEKTYDLLDEREIYEYKRSLKFYTDLRKSVRIRYQEEVDFGEYEQDMQKLLDTYINANEVNKLTKLINLFDVENFDEEVTRIEGKRAKADTIRSAVDRVITEKFDENPAYYQKLADRIKQVIDDYKNKRIGEEDYLSSMQEIMAEMRSGGVETSSYPEKIKECKNSQVIYDNLIEYFEEIAGGNSAADMVADISTEFNYEFNRVKSKPDWQINQDVHSELKNAFQMKLWDVEDAYNEKSAAPIEIDTDQVIEAVLKIAVKRYK